MTTEFPGVTLQPTIFKGQKWGSVLKVVLPALPEVLPHNAQLVPELRGLEQDPFDVTTAVASLGLAHCALWIDFWGLILWAKPWVLSGPWCRFAPPQGDTP